MVLLAAALRLFAIWFGVPYMRARPDEETAVAHAIAVFNGDPNPHFFHWPSLTFYAFAAVYTAASWIKRALFLGPALTNVQYLLLARACVALAGAATVAVTIRMGRRIAGAPTGLVAGLFLAVAVLHVRDSHFAMTDILMTCLVTASLALLLRAADSGDPRAFAAAGFAGGLAASTKYSAAAIVAALAAVQVERVLNWPRAPERPEGRSLPTVAVWQTSAAFLAAFACGFIVATPYAVLDYRVFAADLGADFNNLTNGRTINLGRGWTYHILHSLPTSVGLPIFVAAIAGIVPLARHYGRHALIVGAFAVAFYASLGNGYAVFFRYILPLVPVLCLSAAVGVRHAAAWLSARTRAPELAATFVLAIAMAGAGLVNSIWFDVIMARTDSRVLAADWLVPRLHADETLHEAGGLYAELDLHDAQFHRWSYDPAANSFGERTGRTPDWLIFHESPLYTYAVVPQELRRLARDKYDLAFLVRATRGTNPAESSGVYDLQDAFFMPVGGFEDVERPGPTVLIYRRRDAPPIGINGGSP